MYYPLGPGQVPARQDQDFLPRWSGGLLGETALGEAHGRRAQDPEARARVARAASLRKAPACHPRHAASRARLPRQTVRPRRVETIDYAFGQMYYVLYVYRVITFYCSHRRALFKKRTHAATVIQKRWRGYTQKKKYIRARRWLIKLQV